MKLLWGCEFFCLEFESIAEKNFRGRKNYEGNEKAITLQSSRVNISTPSSDPTSITTPTMRTTKAVSPPLTLSLNHFQLSLILHSHSNFYHCLTLVLTGSTQAFSLGNLPVFIPLSPGKKLDPVTCILLVLIINTHSQPTFM